MNNKKFVKSVLSFILLIIISVSTVNFIVDPGEIYLKKILASYKAQEFSEKLFTSKNGIVETGWNERLVKTTLAKSAGEFDCLILGSSHIKQVSIIRNTGNIQKECKNLINLGVSGGSLEDLAIFSYIVLNNTQLPKKVFIDIDPWTLKFGMDSRYGAYLEYYKEMNTLIGGQHNDNAASYLSKVTKNLINREYFTKSIDYLVKNEATTNSPLLNQKIIYPETSFNFRNGYTEAVTLPDGSHVYDKNWLLAQRKNNKLINANDADSNYLIRGEIYDDSAIKYLEKLLTLYAQKGIKVSFILTPYHPNVFKLGDTKPVIHMKKVEKIITKLAQKNNLKIYGSFFPRTLGCKDNEFLDAMHATSDCLNRINFSK